jgi:anti-sigma B factor antagonist
MDKPGHFTITRERDTADRDGADRTRIRLVLAGEFDLAARDALDGALASALRAGDVVIDMRDVTFLDCSGIGALTRGLRQAWRDERALQVVNADRTVQQMLDLTGLTQELIVLESAHRPTSPLQRRARANGRVR